MSRFVVLIIASLLLAGCASVGSEQSAPLRRLIVESALGQLGRPYRFGGNEPSGFDCSGLVQYTYSEAGVSVPRSTREQLDAGKSIKLSKVQPGDLLFYRFRGPNGLHVGLYIGDGRMIHSPSSGRQVSLARIDEPEWRDRYLETVRLLP